MERIHNEAVSALLKKNRQSRREELNVKTISIQKVQMEKKCVFFLLVESPK